MISVTKEYSFDCAHMLTGHEALCKNLHGHTYKLLVSLEGDRIPEGSSAGMVVDFKDLKKAVHDKVVSQFDHAFIYNTKAAGAEAALVGVCKAYGLRVVAMDCRVTAENMAQFIFDELSRELNTSTARVSCVRLYETPTSYAEVRHVTASSRNL